METRVSFNLAKQRLDYYTCPIGIMTEFKAVEGLTRNLSDNE